MKALNYIQDKLVTDVLRDVDSAISIDATAARQMLEAQANGGVTFANGDLDPVAFAMQRPTWKSYVLYWLRQGEHYRGRKKLLTDARPPVLYLRSFSTHYKEIQIDGKNIIEVVAESFEKVGPVIAIAEPGAKGLMNGPVRLYFDDQLWRAGVIYLMSISEVVIIRAGMSQGTLWELGVAKQKLNPEKLVIYVADAYSDDGLFPTKSGASEFYRDFKAYAEPVMGCELPNGFWTLIAFDKNWEPLILEPGGRTWPAKAVEREMRRQAVPKIGLLKASMTRLCESYSSASRITGDPFHSRNYLKWMKEAGRVVRESPSLKGPHAETFANILRSSRHARRLDGIISQLFMIDVELLGCFKVTFMARDVAESQSSRENASTDILRSLERELGLISELATILETEMAEESEIVLSDRA